MAVSNIEVAISARARWCRWTAPSAGRCSMSTGCRSVRLAGALVPCEVAAGPGAPAVREALEVRKRWQQLRMAVVGAFDRADGDTVVGALEQRDRVAGAHIARMLDGEVGARPGGVRRPGLCVANCYRGLRPGGTLLATAPSLGRVSPTYPNADPRF